MSFSRGMMEPLSGHYDTLAASLKSLPWSISARAARIGRSETRKESIVLLCIGQRVLALLGDAYGRARRIDEAMATGQRALNLAREIGQRGEEARTLYLLRNIYGYGESANATQARESYQQALALAHELGMRPLAARCHFALGELAQKTGEERSAHEHLSAATVDVPRDGHGVLAGEG